MQHKKKKRKNLTELREPYQDLGQTLASNSVDVGQINERSKKKPNVKWRKENKKSQIAKGGGIERNESTMYIDIALEIVCDF